MGIISFSFMWCKDIQNKECNTLKIKSYVQEVFKIKPIVIKTKCRYLEAYEHDDTCLECKGTGEQEKRYIQEQMGKSVFEYDIYNCPTELKGQLKIGDFS